MKEPIRKCKKKLDGTNDCAKTDDIHDEVWYPDSRATNHVTNILSNLNLGNEEWRGKQCIHKGNGVPTRITHSGNAFIQGKRKHYLNNLPRTP